MQTQILIFKIITKPDIINEHVFFNVNFLIL